MSCAIDSTFTFSDSSTNAYSSRDGSSDLPRAHARKLNSGIGTNSLTYSGVKFVLVGGQFVTKSEDFSIAFLS